ncbi:hypothetical protein JCM14076_28530 [Methylosoma difficile]
MKILLILLACLSPLAYADIYHWQDTDGSAHFSDRTTVADAKVLAIEPGYSFVPVKTVYDGDTLQLQDGRKVRLLGINTPEIAHRRQAAEAGGEAAKHWLTEKLKNRKVRLESGVEKTDKYGRILAHVFTEQKEHINLQLVAQGLASVVIYPPNLAYVDELAAAEQQAERARLGIWQEPDYAPIKAENVAASDHQGWTRVVGKITDMHPTRKSLYLNFSDAFSVRIERKNLPLFTDIETYQGKTVEVRGWLQHSKGKVSMLLRHPSAIKLH